MQRLQEWCRSVEKRIYLDEREIEASNKKSWVVMTREMMQALLVFYSPYPPNLQYRSDNQSGG